MKPELIVMLTHKDKTVEYALDLWEEVKDTPVQYWGFKDVGLSTDSMKELIKRMKDAGKTTCLEVVSLSEEEGFAAAKLAVEADADILMGTVLFDSINDYLLTKSVKYFPFPGKIYGHPSILDGSIEEIVAHCCELEAKGVDGLDLLTYRYKYPESCLTLLTEVVKATKIPIVSAGSVASFDRIGDIRDTGAWGFTIGGAFFEKKFLADGSFKDNVMSVYNWLEELETSPRELPASP